MSTKNDTKTSRRSAGLATLRFVGKPKVILTSDGVRIQVTVVNTGPIDIGVGFDVRLNGGRFIEVTNPEVLIAAGKGPMTIELGLPANSGVTRNTRLEVFANHPSGHSLSAGVTGDVSGITKTFFVGAFAVTSWLGISSVIAETPPNPPPLAPTTEQIDEDDDVQPPPDDEAPTVDETPEGRSTDATETPPKPPVVNTVRFDGIYLLHALVPETGAVIEESAVGAELVNVDNSDCDPCRYAVTFNGQEAGEVLLPATRSGTNTVSFATDVHPITWGCYDDETGELVGDYVLTSAWEITIDFEVDGGELWIDGHAIGEFELPGGAVSNCQGQLASLHLYSNRPAGSDLSIPTVEDDSDGDGVTDDSDNCPEVSNQDQQDNDSDGSGDECDGDDDNDGLSDADEEDYGTDPKLVDTDGGGVDDHGEVLEGTDPLDPDDDYGEPVVTMRLIDEGYMYVRGTYRADVDRGREAPDGHDFWWEMIDPNTRQLVPTGASVALWGMARPNPEDCAAVGKSSNPIDASGEDYGQLPVGSWLCFETDQGFIAVVGVTDIFPDTNHELELQYTIWGFD